MDKAPQNLGIATTWRGVGRACVTSGPGKGWDSEESRVHQGQLWNCNLENVLEEASEALWRALGTWPLSPCKKKKRMNDAASQDKEGGGGEEAGGHNRKVKPGLLQLRGWQTNGGRELTDS